MTTVQVSSENTTAERLRVLAQLYQQGQTSRLMDVTLKKLLTHEADLCREQLGKIRNDLAELEAQYGLSSDEFIRRYRAGQTDDRMDYVEWASLVQMRDNLLERLHLLTSET